MSALELPPTQTCLDHRQIEEIFHRTFADSYRTRLQGGASEPLYRPATTPEDWHCVYYTRDYAASALHEIAHWCVAGAHRRQQEDYGYWYAPDGRSAEQQALFEQVEVKPQAYEWIFSIAAGRGFRVSADNLEAGLGASDIFKWAIHQQVLHYCQHGLPQRPRLFAEALAAVTGLCDPFKPDYYLLETL